MSKIDEPRAGRAVMRGLKYKARLAGWCHPVAQFDHSLFPKIPKCQLGRLERQFLRGQKLRRNLMTAQEVWGEKVRRRFRWLPAT